MNTLINKVSEIFKDDDTVTICTYDNKMSIYGICFCNIELRKIWRIIQQEKVSVEINNNFSRRMLCINLTIVDEI